MENEVTISQSRTVKLESRSLRYGTERVAVIPSKRKSATIITANDALQLARALNDEDRLMQMADSIKRAAYYSSVRSYAEGIIDDLKSGDIPDREALIERIHETADGSQMVIYTGQAMDVLRYSDNDGAYGDNYGSEGMVSDGSINWSALAYAALEADINEQLSATIDLNAPFACDECGDTFDAFSDLTEVTDPDGDKRLLCSTCDALREEDEAANAEAEEDTSNE